MTRAFRSTGEARRRRLAALLAVIACHVLVYLLLRSSTWHAQRSEPPPRTTTLRLLPWLAPPPSTSPRSSREPAATAKQPRPAAPAAITLSAPAAISLPTPDATQAQADAAPLPALPALPASQPPRPLELTLPRGYATRPDARTPALDDPRASNARTTPEQRMAAALDTRVIEEDLGDGRRRIRQGDKCVIVQPSRIGQLMPFNDAAARSPSLVGACP